MLGGVLIAALIAAGAARSAAAGPDSTALAAPERPRPRAMTPT
jgi:hypothetical protein